MIQGLDVRRLRLADIADVEEVERRAYSTPWSRTMFAGEIAKATSRCSGAFDGPVLAGYLIVSRYVDAWHVMNVAVDEPYRHRGLAAHMLEELFAATAGDGTRGFTLEVRVSNYGAIRLYERLANHRRDEFEVAPRRDLGHDAAVPRVEVGLRRDDARAHFALFRHERCGGLVATRLEPEDHAARHSLVTVAATDTKASQLCKPVAATDT